MDWTQTTLPLDGSSLHLEKVTPLTALRAGFPHHKARTQNPSQPLRSTELLEEGGPRRHIQSLALIP